jgi:hypothetical protein
MRAIGGYSGVSRHPFHPLLFDLRVVPSERDVAIGRDICETRRMVERKLAQVLGFRDRETEIGNSKIDA